MRLSTEKYIPGYVARQTEIYILCCARLICSLRGWFLSLARFWVIFGLDFWNIYNLDFWSGKRASHNFIFYIILEAKMLHLKVKQFLQLINGHADPVFWLTKHQILPLNLRWNYSWVPSVLLDHNDNGSHSVTTLPMRGYFRTTGNHRGSLIWWSMSPGSHLCNDLLIVHCFVMQHWIFMSA